MGTPSSDLGMYLEPYGTTRDKIAGFVEAEANDPKKCFTSSTVGAGTDFFIGNQVLVDEPLPAAEHEADNETCVEIAWGEVGHG